MTHQELSPSIHVLPPLMEKERDLNVQPGQLSGWRLAAARLAWFTLLAVSVIYFVSGMPTAYSIANMLNADTTAHLHSLGLAENFRAIYILALDSATFVLFVSAAMLIFKERSDGRMALITSAMLVLTAMLYTAPGYEARAPLEIIAVGAALAEVSHIVFLLTFPTGRLFPRWTRWILPPLLIWRYLVWAQIYLPRLYGMERTGENYPFLQQDGSDLALVILFYLFGVATQVYRYRRLATPEQRRQSRGLVWGVTLSIAIVGGYVLALNTFPGMQVSSQDMAIMRLVGRTVRQLALCILPIALLYSVVRYELWNIDVIINSTLVYVPLTSILAVIYATSMSLTQRFFVAATGQRSEFAMVLTTLLLTVVFAPIKDELQRYVDAHFKQAPDPFRNLEAFEEQVNDVAEIIDIHRVSAKLLEESILAFQAVGGAIFLIEHGQPILSHITGRWSGPIILQAELNYGELCVGWLVLGARNNGRSYKAEERARLQATVSEVAHLIALLRLADGAGGNATYLERAQAAQLSLPMPRVS